MIRHVLSLVFVFFSTYVTFSQDVDYRVSTIPADLVKGANAVVRLDQSEINIISSKKIHYSFHRVVTVFTKEGDDAIQAVMGYNPSIKLSKIQVRVYDQAGEVIKKFKERDFKDQSAVSDGSLYEDSRLKYLDYTPSRYPYTIELQYEMETSNTAFMIGWQPVEGHRLSTEKSIWTLHNPENIPISLKETNFEGCPITKEELTTGIRYSAENIVAENHEMFSPASFEIHPRVWVRLQEFRLAGKEGSFSSWEDLGKWIYDELIAGRGELPTATVAEVSALVAGIDDPVEKAKKIYTYVQENTRYISVQLGIGGWQPISAAEVDKVKYGDCKGLTNYTMALLKSQGIQANYAVLYAGSYKRDFPKDFPGMMGNHAILNIPVENGDDIWLECTSQVTPFGFLGDFTDDRDVLLITPEGGRIAHTTSYPDESNTQETTATIAIDEQGALQASVQIETKGWQYDNRFQLASKSEKEIDQYYKRYWGNINGLEISEVTFQNDQDNIIHTEEITVSAPNYTGRAGADYILAVNPLDRSRLLPDRYRNRKRPFEVQRGYIDQTRFEIQLPESYMINKLPEAISHTTKYGTYSSSLQLQENGTLVYERSLRIRSGRFPKEEYKAFRTFCRNVAKADNQKIILTKKQ